MSQFLILKRDMLTREIAVDHQGLSQLRIMRQRTWGSYMFDKLMSRIGICNLSGNAQAQGWMFDALRSSVPGAVQG